MEDGNIDPVTFLVTEGKGRIRGGLSWDQLIGVDAVHRARTCNGKNRWFLEARVKVDGNLDVGDH